MNNSRHQTQAHFFLKLHPSYIALKFLLKKYKAKNTVKTKKITIIVIFEQTCIRNYFEKYHFLKNGINIIVVLHDAKEISTEFLCTSVGGTVNVEFAMENMGSS